MKTQQVTLTTTLLCGATALAPRLACTLAGVLPAAGVWVPGIVDAATDPGQQAPLNVSGLMLATAGAGIAAGAEVEVTAAGKVITKNTGIAIGRAFDVANADGDVIRIFR